MRYSDFVKLYFLSCLEESSRDSFSKTEERMNIVEATSSNFIIKERFRKRRFVEINKEKIGEREEFFRSAGFPSAMRRRPIDD